MNSLKLASGIEKTVDDLLKLHNKYLIIEGENNQKLFAFCYDVNIHTSDIQSSYIIVSIPHLNNTTNKYIYLKYLDDFYVVEMDYLLNSKSTDL